MPAAECDVAASLPPADDRLRLVSEAWSTLPEPIKAGILAMVRTVDQNR